MRTRSLKLSFWLHKVRRAVEEEKVRKEEHEKDHNEQKDKQKESPVKYSSLTDTAIIYYLTDMQ